LKSIQLKYSFFGISLLFSIIVLAQGSNEGLVAHYKFDNSTNDSSPNGNHGTIFGKVTPAPDRFGNTCGAMHFDGATGYITVPNSASLQSLSGSFTITTWLRLDKANYGRMNAFVLSKGGATAQYKAVFTQNFALGQASVALAGNITGPDKDYQNHLLRDESWHFLAFIHDDHWAYAYLDGELVWQMPTKEVVKPNNAPLEIGRDSTSKMQYFAGCLDDVRIYNRSLTSGEIKSLFKESSDRVQGDVFSMKMPRDIKLNAEKGKCVATVNFAKPRVEISCGSYELKQVSGLPAGSQFPVGKHLVVYEATAYDKKLTDSFYVSVTDNEAPSITCPSTIIAKAAYNASSAAVNYPEIAYSDNCANAKLALVLGKKSGEQFPVGATNVNYVVTDAAGNSTSCSFTVIVEKTENPPSETVPQPVVTNQPTTGEPKKEPTTTSEVKKDPAVVVTPPAKTNATPVKSDNQPKPKVTFANAVYRDNDRGKCGAKVEYKIPLEQGGQKAKLIQTAGSPSGSYFPFGSTLNTFTTTDEAGNQQEYNFNVTVRDTQAPVIFCHADTTILLTAGRRGVMYTYTYPTAKDNCKVDTVLLAEGSKSGCFLPVGQHKFAFTARDVSGNTETCSYIVTVEAEPENAQTYAPTFISESLNMGSDSINYEHKAVVKNCMVTIYIFDDGEEDNDTVSVVYNNQILVNREMIRVKENSMIKRYVTLTSGVENYIAAKAWNTGKFGLNTLKIEVYEGYIENDKRDLRGKKPILTKVLHSRPGTAGGMILKCSW
jgi:hypothetical protein